MTLKQKRRSPGESGLPVPVVLEPSEWMYGQNYFGIGGAPPITKTKSRVLVSPDRFNNFADASLFAISLAEFDGEVHALARGMGRGRGFTSNIIHGRMLDEGAMRFDDTPIDFVGPDAQEIGRKNMEDPRISKIDGKYFFTFTDVRRDGKYSIGLASTQDFKAYQYHGMILPGTTVPDFEQYDPKDPVIFPDRKGGVNMLVRFKPGIQLLKFDSMDYILDCCRDEDRCVAFWRDFVNGLNWENGLGSFDAGAKSHRYLDPQMPVMKKFEDKWRPNLNKLNHRIIRFLQATENRELEVLGEEEMNRVWYGTGPAPIETPGGFLEVVHQGQFLAEYRGEDIDWLRSKEDRVRSHIRNYSLFLTLRDEDLRLKAVSPMPISVPNPENELEMNFGQQPMAVPFIKIAMGGLRVLRDNEPNILVPIGVNDKYTRLTYFKEKELLDWMTTYGKVG